MKPLYISFPYIQISAALFVVQVLLFPLNDHQWLLEMQ